MVVQTIHQCAVRFPDVASTVVHLLMDFLGESNASSAVDVIAFVKSDYFRFRCKFGREVIETYGNLRKSILLKLLESLPQVKTSKVYRSALWIIGEYSEDQEDITMAFATIKDALRDILNTEQVCFSSLLLCLETRRPQIKKWKKNLSRFLHILLVLAFVFWQMVLPIVKHT